MQFSQPSGSPGSPKTPGNERRDQDLSLKKNPDEKYFFIMEKCDFENFNKKNENILFWNFQILYRKIIFSYVNFYTLVSGKRRNTAAPIPTKFGQIGMPVLPVNSDLGTSLKSIFSAVPRFQFWNSQKLKICLSGGERGSKRGSRSDQIWNKNT